jgi:hypothetical protein
MVFKNEGKELRNSAELKYHCLRVQQSLVPKFGKMVKALMAVSLQREAPRKSPMGKGLMAF